MQQPAGIPCTKAPITFQRDEPRHLLYFSQSQELRKEFLTLAVTIIFNTVHFVLLYSYKVYIMLFKPQLNTKKAKKRLEQVENDG